MDEKFYALKGKWKQSGISHKISRNRERSSGGVGSERDAKYVCTCEWANARIRIMGRMWRKKLQGICGGGLVGFAGWFMVYNMLTIK